MTQQQANYDAEFCGRVPLHQTNLVQPHGVLLVVDKNNYILQASENTEEIFGAPAKGLVSKDIGDFLTANESLQELFDAASLEKLSFLLQLNDGNHPATLHGKDDFFVLEIETQTHNEGVQTHVPVYRNVTNILTALEAAGTTEEACELAASELKKLSGFDKVMIYRFDESWNGDVIAEAKEDGMDSYLGLKFPASDIPKQARELYKKTAYRLIPNINYQPVKLYPVLNPLTNAFTNLSDSNLRSVAAVHLEYLRNMGVVASMSTRILKDGELWGLIACHHRKPNYLSYEMRLVFELMSAVITTKINALQTKDSLAYQSGKRAQLTALLHAVYQQKETKDILLTLLEADGIAVAMDNKISVEGETPSVEEISDLTLWLSSREDDKLFHSPALPAVYEPAGAFAEKASGLLALPIEGSKGNFILAFRREAVRNVVWGGNPAEAVQYESDGTKYHPRASFKQWQQTVKQTALPWGQGALQTAEEVRNILLTYRFRKQ